MTRTCAVINFNQKIAVLDENLCGSIRKLQEKARCYE